MEPFPPHSKAISSALQTIYHDTSQDLCEDNIYHPQSAGNHILNLTQSATKPNEVSSDANTSAQFSKIFFIYTT